VVAIGNFDVNAHSTTLEFPEAGTWYEVFTGKEELVDVLSSDIELSPGEFRVYTNTFVDLPTSVNELLEETAVSVFPNPTDEMLTIVPTTDLQIEQLQLYGLTGRLLLQTDFRQIQQLDLQYLPKGLYFLKIETDRGVVSKKVVKK